MSDSEKDKTIEEELAEKFPAVLRKRIEDGEFVFPENTEFDYDTQTAYRCYFRTNGDTAPIGREDFRSHAELGRVLRGNGARKAEYYGTSLFVSVEMIENIQSLNKPEKHIAKGDVFCKGGPILRNERRGHICWWMYEDVDLSSYTEVSA